MPRLLVNMDKGNMVNRGMTMRSKVVVLKPRDYSMCFFSLWGVFCCLKSPVLGGKTSTVQGTLVSPGRMNGSLSFTAGWTVVAKRLQLHLYIPAAHCMCSMYYR